VSGEEKDKLVRCPSAYVSGHLHMGNPCFDGERNTTFADNAQKILNEGQVELRFASADPPDGIMVHENGEVTIFTSDADAIVEGSPILISETATVTVDAFITSAEVGTAEVASAEVAIAAEEVSTMAPPAAAAEAARIEAEARTTTNIDDSVAFDAPVEDIHPTQIHNAETFRETDTLTEVTESGLIERVTITKKTTVITEGGGKTVRITNIVETREPTDSD